MKIKYIKVSLSVIFIAFFIYWLTKLNVSDLNKIFKNINFNYIYLFIFCYLLSYLLYAKKYQTLFSNTAKLKFKDFFFLVTSGSFANFIIPSSGEILKIYILKKNEGILYKNSILLILFERLFSCFVMLSLLCGLLFYYRNINFILNKIVIIAFLIFSVSIVSILVILKFFRQQTKKIFNKLFVFESDKKIFNLINISQLKELKNLRNYFSYKIIFFLLTYSTLMFLNDAFKLYFILKALNYDLGYPICLISNMLINFISLLPVIPGSFGSAEFMSITLLHNLFKVPLEINISELILERIFSIILLFILGLVSLNLLKINLKQIKVLKRKENFNEF